MHDPDKAAEADDGFEPVPDLPRPVSPRLARRWRRSPRRAAPGLLTKTRPLLAVLRFVFGGRIVGPIVTAAISIAAYSLAFDWQFGVGLVIMLFVHEMGHVLILRRYGIHATAPIFIPFIGAVVGLRQLPRDAVMEAYVGLGGPVLGSLGAAAVWGIATLRDDPAWLIVAYIGVILNLFNLLPVPPLDGGRAVAAISPWLWGMGVAGLGALLFLRPNPILILIVVFGALELVQIWRRRRTTPEYYRVPPRQRLAIAAIYFGLAGLLMLALMEMTELLGFSSLL